MRTCPGLHSKTELWTVITTNKHYCKYHLSQGVDLLYRLQENVKMAEVRPNFTGKDCEGYQTNGEKCGRKAQYFVDGVV